MSMFGGQPFSLLHSRCVSRKMSLDMSATLSVMWFPDLCMVDLEVNSANKFSCVFFFLIMFNFILNISVSLSSQPTQVLRILSPSCFLHAFDHLHVWSTEQ